MSAGYEIYIATVQKGDEDEKPTIIVQRNEGKWYDEYFTEISRATSFSDIGQIIGGNFVENLF
jgi:hypothetical protein